MVNDADATTHIRGRVLIGPLWGNAIIVIVAGMITSGCFAAMFRMLFCPGETDLHHPKYDVLHDDR